MEEKLKNKLIQAQIIYQWKHEITKKLLSSCSQYIIIVTVL